MLEDIKREGGIQDHEERCMGCGMPTMHSLPWIPLISYGVELKSVVNF